MSATYDATAGSATDASLDPTMTVGAESVRHERARLPQGTVVHRYVIVRHVADGGIGQLYKAYDPELDRPVALKLLRAASSRESGSAGEQRLVREAKALAKLSHPNVVAIYDVGLYGDQVFVAMEFIDGRTFRAIASEAALSVASWLDVYAEAGAGLAAAHRAEIVHRDFKPDNVMRGDDGRVRVLDFGLARAAFAASVPPREAPESSGSTAAFASGKRLAQVGPFESLTIEGSVIGTPRYMAPEQHLGREVDARSDQFSFCVALYEALYGQPPFGRGSMDELRTRVLDGAFDEPPRGVRVPRAVRRVLARGLAVRPSDRFASMDDLLAALARARKASGRAWGIGLGAAAALLVATGAAATIEGRAHRPEPCAGVGRAIDAVWGSTQRQAVQTGFARLGLPYGATAAEGVVTALDAYAARWGEARTTICEATRVRGEQSEALMDRRMACLDARKTSLHALATVLASPDAKTVERSVQAAESLPKLSDCDADVILKGAAPKAIDPGRRAEAEAVDAQVAHAVALEAAGRFDDARAESEAALGAATALGDPARTAAARLSLASAWTDLAAYPKAETELRTAWVEAETAADDTLVARARTMLVRTVGEDTGRYTEAEGIAALAEASLGRAPSPDAIRGDLEVHRASLAMRKNELPLAMERAKRAIEIQERVHGPRSLGVAHALQVLHAVQYMAGKNDEAMRTMAEACAIVEEKLGKGHPYYGTLLAGLGNVEADLGHPDRAIALYGEALHVVETTVGPEHPLVANVTNNLGDLELTLGRFDAARAHFERARDVWSKAQGAQHPFVAIALHNLAEERVASGDPKEAIRLLDEAIAIRRRAVDDTHPDVAEDRVTLGDARLALGGAGDVARARDAYTRARAVLAPPGATGVERPVAGARALVGLAAVALATHDLGAVRPLAQAARALLDDAHDARVAADADLVMARAEIASNGGRATDEAVRLATAARDAYATVGRVRERAAADAIVTRSK